MSLTIQNPEAERLAKDLAKFTGEQLEEVVIIALRERLKQFTSTSSQQLALAAKKLLDDYTNDEELTSFIALDGEPFYAEE